MSTQLKKCPLCGGEVMLCKEEGSYTPVVTFSIMCSSCGMEFKMRAEVPKEGSQSSEGIIKSAQHVIDAFNKRVAKPQVVESRRYPWRSVKTPPPDRVPVVVSYISAESPVPCADAFAMMKDGEWYWWRAPFNDSHKKVEKSCDIVHWKYPDYPISIWHPGIIVEEESSQNKPTLFFVNPRTLELYERWESYIDRNCSGADCHRCPLYKRSMQNHQSCAEFVNQHPEHSVVKGYLYFNPSLNSYD